MKRILGGMFFFFLINLTFAQNFEWAKQIGPGTNHNDFAHSLCIDNSGNSYYTGYFEGTLDFDPDTNNTHTITSNGGRDAFLLKLDSLGNFVWVITLGSTSVDEGFSVGWDHSGNLYLLGRFSETTDFDPGVGLFNLSAAGHVEMFVAKYDVNGNFIFAKQFGAIGTAIETTDLELDLISGIYIVGYFEGTVDFDPGAGSYPLTAPSGGGYGDAFFLKIDTSGNFIWAQSIGSTNLDEGVGVSTDESGNVYFDGYFSGTIDFDFGPGVFNVSSSGTLNSWDRFILKVDPNGNFIWVRNWAIGQTTGTYSNTLKVKSGYVYSIGSYENSTDFDPTAGVYTLVSAGNRDIYVSKFDTAGNFVWARSMGGPTADIGGSLTVSDRGDIYCIGSFSSTADLDPGAATYNQTSFSGSNMFSLKLNKTGDFIWAKSMTGASTSVGSGIAVDANDNVFICGGFWGTSEFLFDTIIHTLGYSFFQDIFTAKWSQDYCSSFGVLLDSLINVSCSNTGFVEGNAFGGLRPYTYSWNTIPVVNDSLTIIGNPGIYRLTVIDSNACQTSASAFIFGPSNLTSIDLNANLIASNFRNGLPTTISLDGFNDGCVPQSGTLQLILDTTLIYLSASPIPDIVNGDTLIWNFNNVTYDSAHITPVISVLVPTWTMLGDSVCLNVAIAPSLGDADVSNNTKQYCYRVENSHDPNIKRVYPTGTCTPHYITNAEQLTYTVQFQNTGNASAIDVYILDTLDVDLNLNTVRVIGNSHSVITEVLQGNVLKFRFDNINLADSTSNEAASHGYVIFEVLPNTGLSNGTTITNNVGIYFDFNPPIYTNTVLNTISDGTINTSVSSVGNVITASLPGVSYQWLNCDNGNSIIAGAANQSYTAITSGNYSVIINDGCFVDTSACVSVFVTGISKVENNNQFSFYPNPSNNSITITTIEPTQLKIINMLGEVVLEKQVQNNTVIDINNLSNGIYFIQTKEGYSTKLIKN